MVRTTTELVPLLASLLVSAPVGGWALEPCYAVAGDTLRCGAQRVDKQIGLEDTPDEWCANLRWYYNQTCTSPLSCGYITGVKHAES